MSAKEAVMEAPAAVETPRADLYGALKRLKAFLPLKARQRTLPKPVAYVHREILRSLAERGKPLTRAEIAAILGGEASMRTALTQLRQNDLVVLNSKVVTDEKTHETRLENPDAVILGAYPMTTEKTPHRVKVFGHEVYAMCAVDALAIGQMFDTETCIDSQCHVTGEPIYICQVGNEVKEATPSRDVRVGIHWQKPKDSAAHSLCTEMVFLLDGKTALDWQKTDPEGIELFTLPEALEYAGAFFLPLMEEKG